MAKQLKHYALLDALLALDMAVQSGCNGDVVRRLWLRVCHEFMTLQEEREERERVSVDPMADEAPEHFLSLAIMDPFGGVDPYQ